MCGIAGVIRFDEEGLNNADIKSLKNLIYANSDRGDSALGMLWTDGHITPRVTKWPKEVEEKMVNHLDYALQDRARIACVHLRAPTDGRELDIHNTHPFEVRDVYLAHNGMLYNTGSVCFENHLSIGTMMPDSYAITAAISRAIHNDELPTIEAVHKVATQLRGQFACWMVYKNTLTLFRCISSLYTNEGRGGRLIFSSVQTTETPDEFAQGKILETDIVGGSKEAKFDAYTPYDV